MAYILNSVTLSTTAVKTGVVVGPGQQLVIYAMDGAAGGETLTMSDGTNTYTSRGTVTETFNLMTYTLLDCLNPTPGTYTLTLSGATGGQGQFLIMNYSGLGSYSAGSFASFHAGSSPPTTTDGCATAAITPSSYPAMIAGFCGAGDNLDTVAVGTGFTSRFAYGGVGFANYAEDLRLISGSHIASFTLSAGTDASSISVIGAAYIEGGSGAALAGGTQAIASATAALTTAPGGYVPILLDDPAHAGGSDEISMGSGPGTGTGDSAEVAFTKLKQWASDGNAMFAKLFPVRSLQTPTTGFTIAAAKGVTQLILNPAGTLATGTITLPPAPGDQQPFQVMTSQTNTALTVNTSDGTTINGAPTTLSANSSVKWRFVASLNTWFRE